jgi:integrase
MFEVTDYQAPAMAWWSEEWCQCYRDFLRHMWARSYSVHTVQSYAGTLTRFFTSVRMPPQAVTRRDVEAFVGTAALAGPRDAPYTSGKPVKARTRNTRIAIISSFYTYAGDYEYLSHGKVLRLGGRNPVTGLRFSKESPALRTMTQEEFSRMLAAIPQDGQVIHARDYAVLTTLWWTARRVSEILSLTWSDIAAATFSDTTTKTVRTGWTYRTATKGSGGSVSTAELPQPAWEAIWRYAQLAGSAMEADKPVFASIGPERGGFELDVYRGLTRMGLYLRMRVYVRLAGMDEHAFSPHSIRHSAAVTRYRNGSSLTDIMKVLGHKHLRTTQIYLEESETTQRGDIGAQLLMEKFANL